MRGQQLDVLGIYIILPVLLEGPCILWGKNFSPGTKNPQNAIHTPVLCTKLARPLVEKTVTPACLKESQAPYSCQTSSADEAGDRSHLTLLPWGRQGSSQYERLDSPPLSAVHES